MHRDVKNIDRTALVFTGFDCAFGEYLQRCAGSNSPELRLTGALLTMELRQGNTALELKKYAGKNFPVEGWNVDHISCPDLEKWKQLLCRPEFSHVTAQHYRRDERTPLVMMTDDRIMLRRYADYARTVSAALLARRVFDDELHTFSGKISTVPDLQDLAVFTAINSRLLILSGGPGTGKTTVCSRILEEIFRRKPDARVLFAAPTGKAQQRLSGQLAGAAAELEAVEPELAGLFRRIEGATLHRFMYRREWRSKLEFCELMVIDECSMIPLELFAFILNELPEQCRLILVGDRRQLSPVESGAVFNDLCCCGQANLLPQRAAEFFNAHGGRVDGCDENGTERSFSGFIVELEKNYRSAQAPAICRIADKLRSAVAEDAPVLAAEIVALDEPDFVCREIPPEDFAGQLKRELNKLRSCGSAFCELPALCASGEEEQIARAVKLAGEFKFIAALRRGPGGVEELNRMILDLLHITPAGRNGWLPGTLLMITANDRYTGLRNGDTGIVISRPDGRGGMKTVVRFPEYDDLEIAPGELPAHEPGFAITVHKAQGSGYRDVLLVLPAEEAEVLSRELFYTAVTRAARYIEIWGNERIITYALSKRESRSQVFW